MGTLAIFVFKKNTIYVFYLFLLTWHTHYLGLEKKVCTHQSGSQNLSIERHTIKRTTGQTMKYTKHDTEH